MSKIFEIPALPKTFVKDVPSELQSITGESSTYKSVTMRQINPPVKEEDPDLMTAEEVAQEVKAVPAKDRTQELDQTHLWLKRSYDRFITRMTYIENQGRYLA